MTHRTRSNLKLLAPVFACILMGAIVARADDATTPQQPASVSIDIADEQKALDQYKEIWRPCPLHVDDHGVYELTYSVEGKYDDPTIGDIRITTDGGRTNIVTYALTATLQTNQFFSVFSEGDYQLMLHMTKAKVGQKYTFKARRYDITVTDSQKAEAKAALDRGMVFLEKGNANVDFQSDGLFEYEALAALSFVSTNDARYRPYVEQQYLPSVAKKFTESDAGIWNGHSVHGIFRAPFGYHHSMTTLALAEIAHGYNNEQARTLATQAVETLLAAQQTEAKSPKWHGPITPDKIQYGGWRYAPDDDSADISISGWCTISLVAAAAADIKVPGLRDGLQKSCDFVRHIGDDTGFGYNGPNHAEQSDIHAGIGTLICLLDGQDSPAIQSAGQYLDQHLFSAVQCDRGEGYPLYYAYYATRANYLRGGFAWEAWRNTMIRQLLNLQKPDGSWKQYSGEGNLNARYGAALSTMILRMCLNDVPNYLKQEVRGF